MLVYCRAGFTIVALGPYGGVDGGTTTAFILAKQSDTPTFIALDAGTLVAGAMAMLQRQQTIRDTCGSAAVPTWMPGGSDPLNDQALAFVQDSVEGAVVTHAHLDHTAALLMASPDLKGKLLVGTSGTLTVIRDSLFNNAVWPSLAYPSPTAIVPEQYAAWLYRPFTLGAATEASDFPQAGLSVLRGWNVSHTEATSAFLVGDALSGECVLFFGDNGPGGELDGGSKAAWAAQINTVFSETCALLSAAGGSLLSIFIETSYAMGRSESSLYGHLTPDLLAQALTGACSVCGNALAYTHLILIHQKPVFGALSKYNATGAAAVQEAISRGLTAPELIAEQVKQAVSDDNRPSCFAPDLSEARVHALVQGQILQLSADGGSSVDGACTTESAMGGWEVAAIVLAVVLALALCCVAVLAWRVYQLTKKAESSTPALEENYIAHTCEMNDAKSTNKGVTMGNNVVTAV